MGGNIFVLNPSTHANTVYQQQGQQQAQQLTVTFLPSQVYIIIVILLVSSLFNKMTTDRGMLCLQENA